MSEEDRLKCKVVLLGPNAAGKTCIINRYVYNIFEIFETTMGASFIVKTISIDENQSIEFEIWDTECSEKHRHYEIILYKDADVCILVYDITRKSSLADLKYYSEMIKENCKPDISK